MTDTNDAFSFVPANVTRNDTVNGRNQPTAVGGTAHGYDPDGNLTSDGATTFAYDVENRLISATGAKNATLTYDPLGRLWQIQSGGATTRFDYDPGTGGIALERDGAGNLLRAYRHGPGVDEPLVWYELTGGPMRRYLHADHQGSILAAADNAGTAIATNRYDEYGVPVSTNAGRFQYTGQIWIGEIGRFHYKSRNYNPWDGRFDQTDSVGYEGGINLYAYVGNDPINVTDPSGTSGTCGTRIEGLVSAGCNSSGGGTDDSSTSKNSGIQLAQRMGHNRPPPGPLPGRPTRMAPMGVRGQAIPGGHLMTKHVGRSERQLRERLQRETGRDAVSSFLSEGIANRALARAVRRNQREIDAWIASGSPFSKTIYYISPTPLGSVLYRGANTPTAGYVGAFTLRPIPGNVWLAKTYDYYAHTGWVE